MESRAEKTVEFVELRIVNDDYDKGLYIDSIFADADADGTQDDDEGSDDNYILFDHFIKINKIKNFFKTKIQLGLVSYNASMVLLCLLLTI